MAAITGKTVIVTGASRGIGLEFVKQLHSRGNILIAACRQPEHCRQQLEALGAGVSVVQLDVASAASVGDFAAAVERLTRHVDVVINNAGVYGARVTLDTVTAEDMLSAFTTNAVGPLLVVQALRRRGLLGGAGGPSLVANVSSKVASVSDNASGGGYAYRASKAALNIVSKSLGVDLACEGVTTTLLHPGWVQTGMTGGKGLIDTETSVAGMLGVLESGTGLLGAWHDYAGQPIPW